MSSQRADGVLRSGSLLPDVALTAAPGGVPVSLRQRGRFARIVVLVHDAACPGCRAYLRELTHRIDEVHEWDGRVFAIVPGTTASAFELHGRVKSSFPILADPEHAVGVKIGIDGAAVLIADQWGELFLITTAGFEHGFPTPDELTDWLRFLAYQCPECEGEAW